MGLNQKFNVVTQYSYLIPYLIGSNAVADADAGEEDEDNKDYAFLCAHGGGVGQVVGLEEYGGGHEDGQEDGVVVFTVEEQVQGE